MSRLIHIRPFGVTLPRAALLVAWMLVCIVAAASPSLATAADKKVDVGMASPGEAEGSLCLPEASGEPSEPHSLTYADLKGGALEVPDDGKIVSWVVDGGSSEPDVMFPDPEASVALDVFEPGIAQHAKIFAQSPPEESSYEFGDAPMTIPPIAVAAGDEVGVTLIAGGSSQGYFRAVVECTNRGPSEYGLWEPSLVRGDSNGVGYKEKRMGEIAVQAQVELDPPVVPGDGAFERRADPHDRRRTPGKRHGGGQPGKCTAGRFGRLRLDAVDRKH